MAAEVQELQLRVVLQDEASQGVAKLRDEIKQLSAIGNVALNRLRSEHSEFAKQIKEVARLASGSSEALMGFVKKLGVAGAAVGGFAATVAVELGILREFADRMVDLTNKAKVIGMDPAELKSIVDQYKRLGIDAGVVERSMGGFSDAIAEVSKIGGTKREEMIQAAGAWGELMEKGIERIEAQTTVAEKLNEVLIQAQNVYDNRLRETHGNIADATKAANDFMKLWQLDPALRSLKTVEKVSDAERARLDKISKATAGYYKVLSDISKEWDDLMDDLKVSELKDDGIIMRGLRAIKDAIHWLHSFWETEEDTAVKQIKEHVCTCEPGQLPPPPPGLRPQQPAPQPQPPLPPPPPPTTQRPPAWAPRLPPRVVPPGAPFRLLSDQAEGAGGQITLPKGWEEKWGNVMSENIEDRRWFDPTREERRVEDSNLKQGEDYVKTVEANTAEMKRLNYNFHLLDKGEVELKGLGGLPGFGGGDGGTPRGGSAPYGSRVGRGTGLGANEEGPPEGGTPSDTQTEGGGSGEVGPQAALAFAKAHLGDDEIRDESKLSALFAKHNMRISPKTTAWCAAWVGTSLEEAGLKGTGSLAAASYYKYGRGVQGPSQAGDIAVWPHHVAMLTGESRVGPGGEQQLRVIGGNQGGTVSGQGGVSYSWRNATGMTVRRPDWEAANRRHDDRVAVDASSEAKQVRSVNVDVSGKLSADVRAPRGSEVKIEGGGAFSKTEMSRTMPLNAD